MYQLEKTFNFEAGHQLVHHDGKCQNPHGHSYILTIVLRGESIQKSGPKKNMIIDFTDLSSIVKPMISEHLDHKWLNDTLDTDSPTTEFIAKWIYKYLSDKLEGLFSVTLQETKSSKVTYWKIETTKSL